MNNKIKFFYHTDTTFEKIEVSGEIVQIDSHPEYLFAVRKRENKDWVVSETGTGATTGTTGLTKEGAITNARAFLSKISKAKFKEAIENAYEKIKAGKALYQDPLMLAMFAAGLTPLHSELDDIKHSLDLQGYRITKIDEDDKV